MAKALETVNGGAASTPSHRSGRPGTRARWMLYLRQHSEGTRKDAMVYAFKHDGHLWQHIHSTAVATSFISPGEASTPANSCGKGNSNGERPLSKPYP